MRRSTGQGSWRRRPEILQTAQTKPRPEDKRNDFCARSEPARRRPSTIHATFTSASGCVTYRLCGRSAFKPTDVLSKSNASATTARWEKKRCTELNRSVVVNRQRASALRTTDLRVLALWHVLVWFRLLPGGFANRNLREQLAVLTGQMPTTITPGRMTYDLRRLRLHGMIEKNPQDPPLPSDRVRTACRFVLHSGPRAPLPSCPG